MCLAALGVIGGLASAASTLASANAQSAQLKAQAKFAERQAEIERERGALEASRQHRTGKRLFGQQVAKFARGGISLSGSPTPVLSDIETENELNTDRIRLDSRAREDQLLFNASLNRSRASASRRKAFLDSVGPLINSASRLASMFT